MNLSEKLLFLRRQRGLSQEELANMLNISRQAIHKWETTQSKPDIDNFKQLSKIFGVSVDTLLNDNADLGSINDVRKKSQPLGEVIADLDEEYIYFNDDIFPLLPCKPTDFFRGGKGILGMSHHLLAWDMFKKICRNSDSKAREALGLKPRYCFLRPQHTCQPMLKSEIKSVYDKLEKDILGSMTPTRTEKNLNQYLYLDYMYLNGKIINERQSKKHFSVAWVSASKLRKFIEQPTHKLTCINDVHLSEERYTVLRTTLIEAFERRMPNKSKYEI